MRYWIAVDKEHKPIDHCEAKNEDEASWKFGQVDVYPQWVIEVPEALVDYLLELYREYFDE